MAAADEDRFEKALAAMIAGTEGKFSEMMLSEDQIKRLGAALHPRVVKLVAYECGLGDSGIASLAASLKTTRSGTLAPHPSLPRWGKCTALEELRLGGNQIGDSGATSLAASLGKCTALTELYLNSNHIGDSGTTSLATSLKHFSALQKLWLHNNRIGDSGAAALAASIPYCPKLTTIYLSGNKISPSAQAAVDAALKGPRRAAPPPSVPAVTTKLAATHVSPPAKPAHPQMPFAVPPLPKGKTYHLFLGHNWGPDPTYANHMHVMKLAAALKALGLVVWIDGERLTGKILAQITSGVEDSCVFVACVTQTYMEKIKAGSQDGADNDWCEHEFSYAHDVLGSSHMIPVVTDPAALNPKQWLGPVRFLLGGALYVDASTEDKLQGAAEEIGARIAKLLV